MRDHSAPRTHARDTSYDSTLSSYRPHHVCIHIRVHFLHRVRTHRARGASAGYLPRVSFHRYPFHGIIFTLSRYSEKRMAAPSFPLFSHPTTHMALCDSHSLAPITGILSQWVPTPFDFIDNLFRRAFRPLRRLGRRFVVPALVTRSTSRSDFTLSRLFRFEVMGARTLQI